MIKQLVLAALIAIAFGILFAFVSTTGEIIGESVSEKTTKTVFVRDLEINKGVLLVINETVAV